MGWNRETWGGGVEKGRRRGGGEEGEKKTYISTRSVKKSNPCGGPVTLRIDGE
jgi:hypothetical protein